jgi:hypothetical protein
MSKMAALEKRITYPEKSSYLRQQLGMRFRVVLLPEAESGSKIRLE